MPRSVLALSFSLVALIAGAVGLVAGGGGIVTYAGPGRFGSGPGPVSFADVVERVNPAVVHITATQGAEVTTDGPGGGVRRGEGSGFIVDPDGYILTNHHLVSSPERIRVRLADKREFSAVLVGADPSTDLALLRVRATGLPAVTLGDSDRLRVGEWVCAIGNPYRFEHSVTVGVVSSKGRKIYDASFDAYIQTDAAINPGNSGGPLINAAGEAVGVNAAVSAQGQGIGFAVPINVAREILGPLRTTGRVSRGYLGIQLQELDPDLQRMMGLQEPHGAVVLDVIEGGAGAAAGLKRYDVITHVGGRPVEDGDQLVRTIAARPPGTSVALSVFRDGRRFEVQARLEERAAVEPGEEGEDEDWEEDHSSEGDPLGLVVADPSPQLTSELAGVDRKGVVVRDVVGLSPGIEAVSNGDVVVEINRHPTPDLASYRRILAALPDGEVAWLFVYRPRPGSSFLAKLVVDRGRGETLKPKVLVIDDEEAIRSSLQMMFEYEGYDCLQAASGPAGLKIVETYQPDIVFLDIKMPQMDGLEVLKALKQDPDAPPIVILSGHGSVKTAVEATKLGAYDFIEKPPDSERILLVARNALSQKKLVEENRRLKLTFDERYRMEGESPALQKVWEAIRRAAPTSATVLITGESGVGKELVARAIHRNSLRKDETFVQVNCAAIPEELIESELFGHEKGSFTGATEKQIGKFELAHKGTIFLDEVGDMSLRTQAKVLRVLQEGEVERIGSQKTIQVDVRVIAATNKDLEAAIEKGEFREDLYFRLSVIPVPVPPLRERPEDITPLVRHFVKQFSAENNFKPRTFTPASVEVLKRHTWRGNARELKNTIERLLIMVEGDEIRPEHLADVLRRPGSAAGADAGAPTGEAPGSLQDFKASAERAFLVQKLRESRWNISATATAIGTPRSNLYKKLEQYAITQEKDG